MEAPGSSSISFPSGQIYFCLWLRPSSLGRRSRWESWDTVSPVLSTLSGRLCLPFPSGSPHFPFWPSPFSVSLRVWESCVSVLPCEWGILVGDEVLSCVFGLWPWSDSPLPLPCRGCGFFFFLISICLCLTRADCGDWCSGPRWGHLRTAVLASACKRSLERECAPAGQTHPGNSYLRNGLQFLRINAQASLPLGKAV